jgi:hypothetical protein
MKLTQTKLRKMIVEVLKESVNAPGYRSGENTTAKGLAEGYWRQYLEGKGYYIAEDFKTVWQPLAGGQELDKKQESMLQSIMPYLGDEPVDVRKQFAIDWHNEMVNILKSAIENPQEHQINERDVRNITGILQKIGG